MPERGRPPISGSTSLLGLTELNNRLTELRKEVAELRDQLNVFENWNSEIKSMYNKVVRVTTVEGSRRVGVLVWSDRYCLCIEKENNLIDRKKYRQIISKGNMIALELEESE